MIKKISTLLAGLLLSTQVFAGDYIVKLKSKTDFLKINKELKFQGLSIVDRHDIGQILKLSINEKQEAKKIAEIIKRDDVEYIVENFQLKAFRSPPSINELKAQ